MADTEAQTSVKLPAAEIGAHHDSEEYESAEEIYEEEVEVEEIEVEEEVEDDEDRETPVAGERQLDDDEDRQNPQFIPKKGYFYEHDDRTKTDEEGEEEVKEEEKVKEEKPKKVKETERWSHDLYDADEQENKTKEEIIATYGYDIRADEQPPKAVRRRRYGRGPKKYTRKSDDVEAYQKPRGGFGGRGRRRGGFNNARGGQEEGTGYEADFPALKTPDVKIGEKANASADAKPPQTAPIRGGRGAGRPPRTNRAFDGDRDRDVNYSDRDRSQNYDYSNRGRGRGGRGRRNEFTNRNRYPDRRENNGSGSDFNNVSGGPPRHEYQDRQKHDKSWMEHDDTRSRASHNGPQTSERNRNDRVDNSSKTSKPNVMPPFVNTEYTGSGSLTASGASSVVSGEGQVVNNPSEATNMVSNGTESKQNIDGRTEQRDNKERDTRGRPQPKPFQAERKSQIPPRLQQQQPVEQVAHASGKSKRFSTQRQRQVGDAALQQAPLPSQIIPQVVPVQAPVVTGAATMVPSPVPNFAPQQNYYEPSGNFEPQVYENTGSPMTGNGPSVSPSLWGPHAAAYATAPYPSPPTGTQVQVAQPPYPDPAAFIAAAQPPGPAIYAAPAQFIQDPAMLNFAAASAPQFAPPYHPQGYQGYAQVTPAPPPEVYHGGVTYYNTHNQIQRPALMTVQKRPKTVLQLVEPPEMKTAKDTASAGNRRGDSYQSQVPPEGQYEGHGTNEGENEPRVGNPVEEMTNKFENLNTSNTREITLETAPGNAESWASQMDQLSPTDKHPPSNSGMDSGFSHEPIEVSQKETKEVAPISQSNGDVEVESKPQSQPSSEPGTGTEKVNGENLVANTEANESNSVGEICDKSNDNSVSDSKPGETNDKETSSTTASSDAVST